MDGYSLGSAIAGSILALIVVALIVGAVLTVGAQWALGHISVSVGWH